MRLMDRLKQAFKPKHHDATLSHYIPAPVYDADPVENSVWQSDLERTRWMDWKGDTGRVPDQQVLTAQGPLLFALDRAITTGLGGTSIPFGQGVIGNVAGFGGRPPQLDATSSAAEYDAVQQ